jgi:hypothetical protein
LRKKLRARFPDTQMHVQTETPSRWSGLHHPPTILVIWLGQPPRSEIASFVTDYANRDDWRVDIRHLFECPQCGREHLTGPDDLPTACSEQS